VEDLQAVVVQARIARAQVDVAGVHLGEVGDHACGGGMLARRQRLHPRGKLVVREAGHGSEDVFLHACL
jgi:hypothetical protein